MTDDEAFAKAAETSSPEDIATFHPHALYDGDSPSSLPVRTAHLICRTDRKTGECSLRAYSSRSLAVSDVLATADTVMCSRSAPTYPEAVQKIAAAIGLMLADGRDILSAGEWSAVEQ